MRNPKKKVTVFKTASSKETAEITLERLYQYIVEGRWRFTVERIRKAVAAGNKPEAERLKKKLPYVCFGGLFRDGSHAATNLTEYSGIIVLDYDNVPPEQLELLKDFAYVCPHTLMTFITPSGRGLKVVVLTNARQEHHALAYAIVADYYDRLLEWKSDGACKDICRGHFGSDDPKALWQDEYLLKVFDVEAVIERRASAGQRAESPAFGEPGNGDNTSAGQTSDSPASAGQRAGSTAPGKQTPVEQSPVGEVSFGKAPSDKASSGKALSGKALSGEALLGDVSFGKVPSGDALSGESPSGEVSFDEAFFGNVPSGESPFGEASSDEASFGEVPSGITADEFVHASLIIFPASEGERNVRLFRLACEARDRGFPREDITQSAIRQMSDGTFDATEITSVVKSAYSRKNNNVSRNREKNNDTNCTFSAQVPLGTKNATTDRDEEDENPDGEELREHTPTFAASVYDHLSDFISSALKYTFNSRERDMLLLSILTILSALIPTTCGFYGNRRVWAYFYTFVVAPAACGKGIMEYAFSLCKDFLKDIADANERLEKKYKEACQAYEKQLRSRKKDEEELSRPEPPVYCYLQIPATVSKSRFLMHLRDNKERGGFIFDLEADTMTASGKQDYGNYFDYLRKVFQHEMISDSFKINEKPTYVYCPKLAILLAGTPAQLVRLIPTAEDGLYSRFLYYTQRQRAEWQDVSPFDDEETVERHFASLAMRLNQMLRFLAASPTRVMLSREQWNRLNKTFGELLRREELSDRDDFQSSIKRHSLITYRICMVLTSIEKATLRMDVAEVPCSDRNFETALSVVTCCLEHSRLLITSLRTSDKDVMELQNPNKTAQVFDRLPDLFTLEQYMEASAFNEIGRRTAFKILKRSLGLCITKIRKGVYQKMPKGH